MSGQSYGESKFTYKSSVKKSNGPASIISRQHPYLLSLTIHSRIYASQFSNFFVYGAGDQLFASAGLSSGRALIWNVRSERDDMKGWIRRGIFSAVLS